MKLNIQAQSVQNLHNNSPIVLVHGLFGSLDSPGTLTRDLVVDHDIIQADMRNHGLSPRPPEMNYPTMAQDLPDMLGVQQIEKATFIGHSIGGEVAITLTALAPDRINRLMATDIAPVDYHVRRHDTTFTAVNVMTDTQTTPRQQTANVMYQHLHEEGIIQSLLRSSVDGEWCSNVPVPQDQYPHITG